MTRRIAGCAELVGAALVLVSTGCRTESVRATHATVRDSAGVEIVENSAPAWAEGAGWRLSDSPRVSIGVVEGDPHYQLSGTVRTVRLSDGRIVVANGGSRELRFYDASGTYVSASGGKGSGPGEFQSLAWLARLPGDSLLAFDPRGARLSVFDAGGHFARSTSVQASLDALGVIFLNPVGVFADGSLGMQVPPAIALGGPRKEGLIRFPVLFLHFDMTGALLDTIGQFAGRETYMNATGKRPPLSDLPFGHVPHEAVSGNELYFGAGDRYEIGAYAPDGTLTRLIRRSVAPLEVTQADIDAEKQEALDGVRQRGGTSSEPLVAGIERLYARMPIPKTMPAYGDMRSDAAGNLWVENYRRPSDTQPMWTVFDSTGQLLGELAMPERFAPLDIGADYVLGTWRDELDVQYVRLYALEKGQPTARVATVPRR